MQTNLRENGSGPPFLILHVINTRATSPVLETYVHGGFPTDKKFQEQQAELLFDTKIRTSLRLWN